MIHRCQQLLTQAPEIHANVSNVQILQRRDVEGPVCNGKRFLCGRLL
jgi:hypothetical protein